MIYITGDTHGGFQRFSTDNFPQQKQMSRSDYAIIAGDFGGLWDDSPREAYWLDWLEEKPFTSSAQASYPLPRRKRQGSLTPLSLLSPRGPLRWDRAGAPHVDGNHEYFDYGRRCLDRGKAQHSGFAAKARSKGADAVFAVKRKRSSADFATSLFRVKGVSWWPQELPSEEEYEEAVKNLERVNWKVDCVLTHCAPTSILKRLDGSYSPDRLTDFLQMVKRQCQFDYGFLGHYHRNCVVDDRFIIQWKQMVELQWE